MLVLVSQQIVDRPCNIIDHAQDIRFEVVEVDVTAVRLTELVDVMVVVKADTIELVEVVRASALSNEFL